MLLCSVKTSRAIDKEGGRGEGVFLFITVLVSVFPVDESVSEIYSDLLLF